MSTGLANAFQVVGPEVVRELFGYVKKLFEITTLCTTDFVNANWKTSFIGDVVVVHAFSHKSNDKDIGSIEKMN